MINFSITPDKYLLNMRDYLYEFESQIDGFQSYKDSINPNWFILNETIKTIIGGQEKENSNVPLFNLLQEGIIKVCVVKEEKIEVYFCLNKLKLHCGLISKYGDATYLWQYEKDRGELKTYNNLTDTQKSKIQEWYNKYNDVNSYSDNYNQIQWWVSDTAAADSSDSITPIQEGWVGFCNVFEDTEIVNPYNKTRQDASAYLFLLYQRNDPVYIPYEYVYDEVNNTWKWEWQYTTVEESGKTFALTPPLLQTRLLYDETGYFPIDISINNYLYSNHIHSKNKQLWNKNFKTTPILNQLWIKNDDNFYGDELIIDEKIKIDYPSTNYYNIDIDNSIKQLTSNQEINALII